MKDVFFELVLAGWETVCEMAPYLLLGFFIAGILSVFLSPDFVRRHLGRGRWTPVWKATLLGVPLPLCSCGVIPVAVSLHKQGASKGATAGFLISTPQTGVDSIAVTYSMLGPVFALLRPVAALLSGLIGGFVITATEEAAPGRSETEVSCSKCCGGNQAGDQAGGQATEPVSRPAWWRVVHHAFVVLPKDLAGPVFVGILLAAVIKVFVGDGFFDRIFPNEWLAMGAMLVVGLPMYVCATGSIPIAAAMMAKGLSPGAALVFLMAGPATNTTTLTTLWSFLGKRSCILYVITVMITALGFGCLLNQFWSGSFPVMLGHVHESGLSWVDQVYGLLITLLLVPGLVAKIPLQTK